MMKKPRCSGGSEATSLGSRAEASTAAVRGDERARVPQDHRVLARDQPPHVQQGDAVQHDGDDDLVGPRLGLEGPGNRPVEEPGDPAGHEQQHDGDGAGQATRERPGADPGAGRGTDEQLTLGADVEQSSPEGEGHGQRRADEGCGAAQRGGDAVGVAVHATQERPVRLQRVLADDQDGAGADDEGGHDGQEGHEQRLEVDTAAQLARDVGGAGVAHATASRSLWPVAMSRPICSRLVSSRSNSPTSSPR